MTDKIERWELPGVNGNSVIAKTFKVLNPVEQKKKEEEQKQQQEEKIKAEELKGYNKGLEQGKKEAYQAESIRLQELAKKIDNMAAALNKAVKTYNQDVVQNFQTAIEEMVINLTRTITKNELQTNPAVVTTMVKECLDCLTEDVENLQLIMSKEDFNLVKDEMFEASNLTNDIKLTEDTELKAGQIRVLGKDIAIDVDLPKRLEELLAQIDLDESNGS